MNLIGKINLRERKDIILLIIVVVIAIFISRKILDKGKEKIASVKSKIENYKETIKVVDEINQITKEIKKFDDVGWPTKEMVQKMEQINKLASQYNIDISTFDPGQLISKDYYFTLSMTLNIEADYFDFVRFISAIERLKSLTKVISLRITPVGDFGPRIEGEQGAGPRVRVYLNVEAYMLK